MPRRQNEIFLKISIIIPCYNAEKYIAATIDSIISQEYPEFELFIKDGGSKDSTVKIIKSYAKKFPKNIKWISKKDKGQSDAINIGLKKVNGDIITYINADDIYKVGAFSEINAFFLKYPKYKWVIGKCDIIDKDSKEIRQLITYYKNFWLDNYSYKTLLIINYISQMGVFWRKEVMKGIGFFDVSQYYVMDYEYWLRIGKKYQPGLINKYLASFRIIETSKSSIGFFTQFKNEYQIAKLYTSNKLILFLHLLHTKLIISVYSLMKGIND